MIIWALQLGGSLVSVVLYVWSTYAPAAPGGPRYCLGEHLPGAWAETVHKRREEKAMVLLLREGVTEGHQMLLRPAFLGKVQHGSPNTVPIT